MLVVTFLSTFVAGRTLGRLCGAQVKGDWVISTFRDKPPVWGKSLGLKAKGEDVNLEQRQTHSFGFAPPACQWLLIKTWEEQQSDLLRLS